MNVSQHGTYDRHASLAFCYCVIECIIQLYTHEKISINLFSEMCKNLYTRKFLRTQYDDYWTIVKIIVKSQSTTALFIVTCSYVTVVIPLIIVID